MYAPLLYVLFSATGERRQLDTVPPKRDAGCGVSALALAGRCLTRLSGSRKRFRGFGRGTSTMRFRMLRDGTTCVSPSVGRVSSVSAAGGGEKVAGDTTWGIPRYIFHRGGVQGGVLVRSVCKPHGAPNPGPHVDKNLLVLPRVHAHECAAINSSPDVLHLPLVSECHVGSITDKVKSLSSRFDLTFSDSKHLTVTLTQLLASMALFCCSQVWVTPDFTVSYLWMAIVNLRVQRLYRHHSSCATTLLCV